MNIESIGIQLHSPIRALVDQKKSLKLPEEVFSYHHDQQRSITNADALL